MIKIRKSCNFETDLGLLERTKISNFFCVHIYTDFSSRSFLLNVIFRCLSDDLVDNKMTRLKSDLFSSVGHSVSII